MTLTPQQIKATAEGTCCRWCRIPLDLNDGGRWVSSGGWDACTGRRHEPGPYIEAEAAAPDPVADPTMLCGKCQHPMHWRECGADADLTAPCQCRNDVATDPVASPADSREPAWVPFIVEAASLIGGDWAGRLQVAIEGAVASPAPLDVERLARALDVLSEDGDEYALMAPEDREYRYEAAQRLAAAYAEGQPVAEESA